MELKEFPPPDSLKRLEELNDSWLERCLASYWSKRVEVRRWSYQAPETREGILSEMFFVDVDYVIDGEEKEEALVFKFLPRSEEMLALVENLWASHREITMYKFLFSEAMKKVYHELEIEILVPKVFYAEMASGSMTLVMRNLRRDGFRTIVTTKGLGLWDLKTYMKTIAMFHACGVVYKAREGRESMESLNNPPVNLEYCGSLVKNGFVYLSKLFSGSPLSPVFFQWSERWKDILSLLSKKMTMQTCVSGDFWANNVMYNGFTGSVKILDWQFSHFGNPIQDIVVMLVMSGDPSALENHLYEILGVYWDSYRTVVHKGGVEIEGTFTDLLETVESLWIYGLAVLCIGIDMFIENGVNIDAHLVSVVNFLDKRGVLKIE
ncbi:uncharacterized protein LOC143040972 [Oratosquilla oratoria]|uniref:uncharacterized protein LOC143040972 n=1 Tax=Oratosquilla oratoria TaxID=337810 RepID=UPI003F76E18A